MGLGKMVKAAASAVKNPMPAPAAKAAPSAPAAVAQMAAKAYKGSGPGGGIGAGLSKANLPTGVVSGVRNALKMGRAKGGSVTTTKMSTAKPSSRNC